MSAKQHITGVECLVVSILFFLGFMFVVWVESGTRCGSNFDHEAWTLGRAFELWWLWLTLPPSGAAAVLSSMRSRGWQRAIGLLVFASILGLSTLIGYQMWTAW